MELNYDTTQKFKDQSMHDKILSLKGKSKLALIDEIVLLQLLNDQLKNENKKLIQKLIQL